MQTEDLAVRGKILRVFDEISYAAALTITEELQVVSRSPQTQWTRQY
jgi:hypothetical protein